MKKRYGSLLVLGLLASRLVSAGAETPYLSLNGVGSCTVPFGYISAVSPYATTFTDPRLCVIAGTYNIISTGEPYGYYSPGYIDGQTGLFVSSIQWIDYSALKEWYVWAKAPSGTYASSSQCATELLDDLIAHLNETPETDPDKLYEFFFPVNPPLESRLPLDADLDEDGRPDYYDLECPYYDEYLEFCQANGIAAGDLQDYMYYYQMELSDYYMLRLNTVDTDGDGFSDGYELIHGTNHQDGTSYPLGRPDVGTTTQVMGGVDSDQPWRFERYMDSDWSKGHVYDMGYDPFGDTSIEVINGDFVGPPDWYALDSSGDGLSNYDKIQAGQNPYEFNFQPGFVYVYDENGGYWTYYGGVTDGDFPDWTKPPTYEDWLEEYENYHTGEYLYNPSEFAFEDSQYDTIFNKFNKIKVDFDDVRPAVERDYRVTFNIPIPGGRSTPVAIAVVPDASLPGGAALENLRLMIRGMTAVVISYLFVRHVWLVIRQY
jgi:hypothetical protein